MAGRKKMVASRDHGDNLHTMNCFCLQFNLGRICEFTCPVDWHGVLFPLINLL
jgi:hypothetical protein